MKKEGPTFVGPQVEVETLGVSEILDKLGWVKNTIPQRQLDVNFGQLDALYSLKQLQSRDHQEWVKHNAAD